MSAINRIETDICSQGDVAGRRLGALEGGGGTPTPLFQCIPGAAPQSMERSQRYHRRPHAGPLLQTRVRQRDGCTRRRADRTERCGGAGRDNTSRALGHGAVPGPESPHHGTAAASAGRGGTAPCACTTVPPPPPPPPRADRTRRKRCRAQKEEKERTKGKESLWLLEAPVREMIRQMHTPVHTSQCWSRQTPARTRSVHRDAPGQQHGQQPVSGTADPRSSQTGQVIRGLR